jgi:hypothetical protein
MKLTIALASPHRTRRRGSARSPFGEHRGLAAYRRCHADPGTDLEVVVSKGLKTIHAPRHARERNSSHLHGSSDRLPLVTHRAPTGCAAVTATHLCMLLPVGRCKVVAHRRQHDRRRGVHRIEPFDVTRGRSGHCMSALQRRSHSAVGSAGWEGGSSHLGGGRRGHTGLRRARGLPTSLSIRSWVSRAMPGRVRTSHHVAIECAKPLPDNNEINQTTPDHPYGVFVPSRRNTLPSGSPGGTRETASMSAVPAARPSVIRMSPPPDVA